MVSLEVTASLRLLWRYFWSSSEKFSYWFALFWIDGIRKSTKMQDRRKAFFYAGLSTEQIDESSLSSSQGEPVLFTLQPGESFWAIWCFFPWVLGFLGLISWTTKLNMEESTSRSKAERDPVMRRWAKYFCEGTMFWHFSARAKIIIFRWG